jgi:hypothetical protein
MLQQIIDSAESFPFSSDTIKRICNGKVKIMAYDELANVSDIVSILKKKPICLLYQTNSATDGHWVAMCLNNNTISYFDSYGFGPDYYPNKTTNKKYLSYLLNNSGLSVNVNKIDLQKEKSGVNTCGRFAATRCVFSNLTNSEYVTMMCDNLLLHNPDDIATLMTLISY